MTDRALTRKWGWAATVLLGVCAAQMSTGASAQDLPPGVTVPVSGAFAPPDGLGAFEAMTFVIDMNPRAAFPLHSHPGRSKVMVIEGDLTELKPSGEEKVYHAGDSFIEEPNVVHKVTNAGSVKVRLVWTLLLPDGTEAIVPH